MSNPLIPKAETIVIREITELAEMRELESVQREVWRVEDIDVLPALALRPQVDVGAILIGAFKGREIVGFVYGYPGFVDGQTIIHSDMLAVKPEFRRFGLGYLMKLAQRDKALEQNIDCITWTFDPLQLRNANLNFGRLGVTSNRYLVDYYGQTSSFLHSFGTDRLWVKWLIKTDRVKDRIQSGVRTAEGSNELADIPTLVWVGRDGEPLMNEVDYSAGKLLIEIPGDINKLVSRNDGSAMRWREVTRDAFLTAINAGYSIEDFFVVEKDLSTVGMYLLVSGR
jgi:predicted GNAT superfamily acetyltransferase